MGLVILLNDTLYIKNYYTVVYMQQNRSYSHYNTYKKYSEKKDQII